MRGDLAEALIVERLALTRTSRAVNRWGDTAEQIEERRRALERGWRDGAA